MTNRHPHPEELYDPAKDPCSDLLAAAQDTSIFLFNLWANGPESVSLEAVQEMRERLGNAIRSAKEAGAQ